MCVCVLTLRQHMSIASIDGHMHDQLFVDILVVKIPKVNR